MKLKIIMMSIITIFMLQTITYPIYADTYNDFLFDDGIELDYDINYDIDEFLNFTNYEDEDCYNLHQTLYTAPGNPDLMIQIKTFYGHALNAKVLNGSVNVKINSVPTESHILRPKYSYSILTISGDTSVDCFESETYKIQLNSNDTTIYLSGKMNYAQNIPILSDMHYNAQNYVLFQFMEELEEESVISFGNGFSLAFLGNYENSEVNLTTDNEISEQITKKYDTSSLFCWNFTASPFFENPVTVRIQASPTSKIFECLNTGIYPIKADYKNGKFVFQTQKLTSYVMVN